MFKNDSGKTDNSQSVAYSVSILCNCLASS